LASASDLHPAPEQPKTAQVAQSSSRALGELFVISFVILFLELACIRWFPAHVVFLTFFTNTVLLASFLGMSVGCLAASRKQNFLVWTPALLGLGIVCGHAVERLMAVGLSEAIDVGNQASPQFVFFGAEYASKDLASFRIPVEVLGGFFFVLIALIMVGPGQELGRALGRVPNRVLAYTVNILGSIAGIVLFAGCSLLELGPFWWFLPVVLSIAYFIYPRPATRSALFSWCQRLVLLGLVLFGAGYRTGSEVDAQEHVVQQHLWSPYYRIDYNGPPRREIGVNLLSHQTMISKDATFPGYALPHLINRDTGGRILNDVLIIGTGSGNDISRALQWGAQHVDAVDIDPVIPRLGQKDHPDRPYDDPRVRLILDDGRNVLRASDKQYDLIVYALVDSLVLHSSYSNIRLESYLFTQQAFDDIKRHLKPGGLFFMYNFYRQGWIVHRLEQQLVATFGAEPIVITLPSKDVVQPEESWNGFTIFLAGGPEEMARMRQHFQDRGAYWLSAAQPPGPDSPDGFQHPSPTERQELLSSSTTESPWRQFAAARVTTPQEPVPLASDDWPFLYLRRPMIPDLSWRGMAIMSVLSLLLIVLFMPRGQGQTWSFSGRMFFLGAGFMLVETKAVVHMALLFGSTWMVNSVVFFAVLVMILAANLFVLAVKPRRLWPYYAGLLATLILNAAIPLDTFLGMERVTQVASSCLLVFTPILFAAVIFAVSFSRTPAPDYAFGANIAGAVLGGLAENFSMLLGFQYLVLLAVAFYVLSAVFRSSAPVKAA
jgi:SAM-dependent methyltransferase